MREKLQIELWEQIKEVEIIQQQLLAQHVELTLRKFELSNNFLKIASIYFREK